MNRSKEHTALIKAILADLGAMPGIVIGENPSGHARYPNIRTGKDFHVPYGWPSHEGGADILLAVAPLGRLVALEAKTGAATTTKEQRQCHAALRAVGVIVAVVHNVAEARAAVEGVMK